MSTLDIRAEISAQADLLKSMPLNHEIINDIDRHIKDTEDQLNARLIHVDAKIVIKNFLSNWSNYYVSFIEDEIWKNFTFDVIHYRQNQFHEEISFEKGSNKFGFVYTSGEVIFDIGFINPESEYCEIYVKIMEDKRKTYKVIAAPVEVKLKSFQHLRILLNEILVVSNNIYSSANISIFNNIY